MTTSKNVSGRTFTAASSESTARAWLFGSVSAIIVATATSVVLASGAHGHAQPSRGRVLAPVQAHGDVPSGKQLAPQQAHGSVRMGKRLASPAMPTPASVTLAGADLKTEASLSPTPSTR